jgi:hypothetical protein
MLSSWRGSGKAVLEVAAELASPRLGKPFSKPTIFLGVVRGFMLFQEQLDCFG